MGVTIATAACGSDLVDPAWLSAALGVQGTVTALRAEQLGGSGGASRVHLGYARPGDGPASVVVKTGGTRRAPGAHHRELRFLSELAPDLGAGIPRVLAVAPGTTSRPSVLVLEDLVGLRAGDQAAGCTPHDLATGLGQIARVHASGWGDSDLARHPWLNRGGREWPAVASLMPDLVERFCQRHAGTLSGPELAAVERLATCAGPYFASQPGPWSLRHGDLRAAHVLTDPAGRLPAKLVDWQSVVLGPATADVAFLLGGSLTVVDRRGHEIALLRGYHTALRTAGVTDYPWDRCFADYRRHALGGLFRAIASAAPDTSTPHGDELLCTMARRHAAHADDLESAAVL